MDESNVWGARRFITILVVLALHVGFLALFVVASRTRSISALTEYAVELMFLPPPQVPNVPKVRAENARPGRLSADTAISITLPGFDPASPSPPLSGSGGDGSGVDWMAEAHRAVQAFEIRRSHPPGNALSSAWNGGWPQGEHHACDLFKTESGDWIVWINASCYQVARSGAGTGVFATGTTQSQTICPRQLDMPRGDLVSQLPSCRKLRP